MDIIVDTQGETRQDGIHVGPAIGTLFTSPLGTQLPGQTSTIMNVGQSERLTNRNDRQSPGLDLNLVMNAQTPDQVARPCRRKSKRRSKQPMVEPESQGNQVIMSESYLQSILAQIIAQGGIPPKYPLEQRPGHSVAGSS